MTPQLSTINKYDLLLVLKDFSEERSGEIDSSGSDLNLSFSIVGENPPEIGTSNDSIIKGQISLSEEMEKQVKTQITNLFYNIDAKAMDDKEELALFVRKSVKNYLFKATKKNPMILPVIMEI